MKNQRYPLIQCFTFLALGLIGGAILGCHLLAAFTPSDTIPPEAAPRPCSEEQGFMGCGVKEFDLSQSFLSLLRRR
jgi:hypothetical protein